VRFFFFKKKYTDKKIVAALLQADKEQTKCLYFLYKKQFPVISKYITQNNGNTEEAKEVFHSTLIVFQEQVKSGQFDGSISIEVFIQAIAKAIWHKKLNLSSPTHQTAIFAKMNKVDMQKVQSAVEQYEQTNSLLSVLDALGEDCKKILTYNIYKSWSIPMITRAMGSKNPHNIRSKKDKCNQRLKDLIKANPSIHALLENAEI